MHFKTLQTTFKRHIVLLKAIGHIVKQVENMLKHFNLTLKHISASQNTSNYLKQRHIMFKHVSDTLNTP